MTTQPRRRATRRRSDTPPPKTGSDERDVLVGFLDYLRTSVAAKVERCIGTDRPHPRRRVRHQPARPHQAPHPRGAIHLPK
jgi:hypothetical protein